MNLTLLGVQLLEWYAEPNDPLFHVGSRLFSLGPAAFGGSGRLVVSDLEAAAACLLRCLSEGRPTAEGRATLRPGDEERLVRLCERVRVLRSLAGPTCMICCLPMPGCVGVGPHVCATCNAPVDESLPPETLRSGAL